MSVIDADKAGTSNEDGSLSGDLAWLYEKFDFEFEFFPLTWDNYVDQTRMWLASNEAPDLMMLDVAAVRYTEFVNNVNEGMFRPYTGYENYPNLKEKMDTASAGKKFIVNGELYAWPAFLDTSEFDYRIINGACIRKDWAQAVGLYQEDRLYSWDEWVALIKEVLAKDPGGNGAGKTIGMIGVDWQFPKYFGPGNLSPYMLQYGPDNSGGYTWGPLLPESLEVVKLTKQLYDEGLIWSDEIMVKSEDPENKMNSNQLFARIWQNISAGALNTSKISYVQANPGAVADDILDWVLFEGPNGKVLSYQANDHWSQEAMNANLSDEKANRWMEILDYLASEEGYYFRTLGIPEVDWSYVDGVATANWTMLDDNGNLRKPYDNTWNWGRAAGAADNADLGSPTTPQSTKDNVHALYDIILDDSLTTVIPVDIELNFFTGEQYSSVGTMESDIYQQVQMLMVSNDVEKDWNAWLDTKRPLVQPAIDELNAALKQR
jgi:putative aldouronate transport system substrate-binding protein